MSGFFMLTRVTAQEVPASAFWRPTWWGASRRPISTALQMGSP